MYYLLGVFNSFFSELFNYIRLGLGLGLGLPSNYLNYSDPRRYSTVEIQNCITIHYHK